MKTQQSYSSKQESAILRNVLFLLILPTLCFWVIFPYSFPNSLGSEYLQFVQEKLLMTQIGYMIILTFPLSGLLSCALISRLAVRKWNLDGWEGTIITLISTVMMMWLIVFLGLAIHLQSISLAWTAIFAF